MTNWLFIRRGINRRANHINNHAVNHAEICPSVKWSDASRRATHTSAVYAGVIAGVMLSCLLLMAPSVAMADADLARKNSCFACHAVDKKLVGPSYQDVAAKYDGQKNAAELLFEKVKKGGAGVWGQIPMPPNTAAKDEDIRKLVAWILGGAK